MRGRRQVFFVEYEGEHEWSAVRAEDRAHEYLPRQYNVLAAQLLDEIAETLDTQETCALLRRAGRRHRCGGGMPRSNRVSNARLDSSLRAAPWRKED